MAITPKNAKEKAKPKGEDLKKLEEKIDEMLISKLKIGETSPEISYSVFPNQYTREYIANMYRKNGWTVTDKHYQGDFRERDEQLDFLKFTEKKTKRKSPSYIPSGLRPYETT